MIRVKTDGVKENFKRATLVFIKLGKARDVLQMEWRSKMGLATCAESDDKMTDRVEELEVRVMDVLGQVQNRLSDKEKVLAKLVVSPVSTAVFETCKTDVVKQPRGGPPNPTKLSDPLTDKNVMKKSGR